MVDVTSQILVPLELHSLRRDNDCTLLLIIRVLSVDSLSLEHINVVIMETNL